MLFQVDVAIRQQEPPRWHGFLHTGAFGAIEVIVLGDKPGMADMVTELHTVCVDDVQVGEIRYAREALQKHLSEVQEAEQSVYRLQSEPSGRLRISAPESLAMSLLPEVLPHFRQAFPKLELDIRITGRFVDLVEEGIDVALRVGTLDDSSLIARKLMPCRFHICASPDYLNRHGRPKHPNELARSSHQDRGSRRRIRVRKRRSGAKSVATATV